MPELAKLCCFSCPERDYTEKSLDDVCPTCGRSYGFPLTDVPAHIGQYRITRALGRGFYAATYIAERSGPLKTKHVLKVSPIPLYEYFGKNFIQESTRHAEVADGAEYIVGISDLFDEPVNFGSFSVTCHVAVLEYIDGELLSHTIANNPRVSAATAAQISADLFRLKAEFERKLVNHNDLHSSNIIIQHLTPGMYRQGAMNPAIRAVAIDLGSVATDRRSAGKELGDLHWIATHIQRLSDRLLDDLDSVSDQDSRVGHALQKIAQSLVPHQENQRTPSVDDFVRLVEEQYFKTSEPWRPWRTPLVLRTFSASYNAQTLDAWHVPQLLVDPDGTWLAHVSSPGPLVMTGMRGCGKTLLLRAAQFHARAAKRQGETDTECLLRLEQDNYVGLLVSAQRLLNVIQAAEAQTENLFPRLFVAYALEAARALAHLQDIASDRIVHDAQNILFSAVMESLQPVQELVEFSTIEQLERHLGKLLVALSRSDSHFTLMSHPSNAFPALAEAVRRTSTLWNNAQVLFLLDDVSTRYMQPIRIEELLSALIFQHPACAFKVTSEAQTIFLTLKSPGLEHPAAHGRDLETFDLGSEVNRRLKNRTGTKFVEDILRARGRFYPGHPQELSPSDVLGDVPLERIAETIAQTKPDSNERKRVYRGLSALSNVCVGDIGSVITIYEEILTRSSGKTPVSDATQNEVFQDFCSRSLYLLDRRGSHLKDVAQSFAEAAHELLLQSGKQPEPRRLRQYASLYVRVTTGNFDEQMVRLRELVDAGIFVFTGGAPRTKTRDSNPVQQFKLTYRKMYGLVNFIGLSERDRFELSGKDLEDWLRNPADGKAILQRNLMSRLESPEENNEEENETVTREPQKKGTFDQPRLRLEFPTVDDVLPEASLEETLLDRVRLPLPNVTEIPFSEGQLPNDGTVVLGLGFESRTAESTRRLLSVVQAKSIVAVRYPVPGHADEILSAIRVGKASCQEIDYQNLALGNVPDLGPTPVIDITGLAKPAIFHVLRQALMKCEEVYIVYTEAEGYYPLEADLQPILTALSNENHHQLFVALKGILTGEKAPYRSIPLLPDASDGTRLRALLTFASSKHERLIHLVEERDFDLVEVVVAKNDSPRSRISQIAAEVAVRGSDSGLIKPCDVMNLNAILNVLQDAYEALFIREGFNFEIGLTGNKLETVAAAILSSACRLNQVWYVSPAEFDTTRFTKGFGSTRTFKISRRR